MEWVSEKAYSEKLETIIIARNCVVKGRREMRLYRVYRC